MTTPEAKKSETDTPDKLDGQSLDLRAQRLAALKALLPEVFDLDGNLVQDKLLAALEPASYDATDDIPTFGLGWPGKQRAFAAAGVPTTATLRPCPEQSVDFDTTQNLLIEGDNLEVLKTLQRSYHGKVKMIYIDPPYNTGKDFVYPDNYGEGLDTYLKRTQQKDEDGFWQSTNSETSGRKHANWLSMMTPRLSLARNLLRDDGVIFISIDDNEVANLKSLCDEVIGAENFLGKICVVSNLKGRSDDKHFATAHNYLLAYTRANFETYGVPLPEEYLDDYPETDSEGNRFRLQGLRKRGAGAKREDRPNMFYPFYISPTDGKVSVTQSPIYTVEVFPQLSDGSDGRWRWGRDTADQRVDELRGQTVGSEKRWDVFQIDFAESGGESKRIKPKTLWMGSGFANESGTLELKKLLGKGVFDTPKPIGLVNYMLHFATASDKSDIILDFFAGSGTTGHAVMAQNAEDGGNRRYICVQLPEPLPEPVTLDDGVVCETIFDLTRERLKRAGKKIKDEAGLLAEKLDTGLRVFKLDSSNFTAWNSDPTSSKEELLDRLDQLTDHTVPGRSEIDILWEMLLKMGLPLDLKLECFELEGAPGTTFIGVNDRTRVVSTQTAIPIAAFEALLDSDVPPAELVVLDCAFEDDTARANIATLYKQRKDEDGKPVCNLKVV